MSLLTCDHTRLAPETLKEGHTSRTKKRYFWRNLTFFSFFVLPSVGFAEVCDKERPHWDGMPVTAFEQLWSNFVFPFGVVAVVMTLFALWMRSWWSAGLAVLPWALLLFVQFAPDLYIDELARKEGCLGPKWLSKIAFTALMFFVLSIPFWRRRNA